MSASNLSTYKANAAAAVMSGDYATARQNADAALVTLSMMADAGGPAGTNLTWDREAILQFIVLCDQRLAASATTGGIRRTRVNYVNPTSDDCD